MQNERGFNILNMALQHGFQLVRSECDLTYGTMHSLAYSHSSVQFVQSYINLALGTRTRTLGEVQKSDSAATFLLKKTIVLREWCHTSGS